MQSEQGLGLPGLKEPQHKVYVGSAGWSYKDWSGIVYPEKHYHHFDELQYLANLFDVIEINSSFYKIPSSDTVKNWLERVSFKKEFLFTIKLWKEFTHDRAELLRDEIANFHKCLAILAEEKRLGCLLIQFPWSLYYNQENLNWLKMLITDFSDFKIAVEVRNIGWLNKQYIEFLKKNNCAFCNIDLPNRLGQIPPTEITTAPFSYVRLHGRNYKSWFREGAGVDERYDYLYSQQEIQEWVTRILHLKKEAKEVFIITNNHFCGKAVCNALEIKAKVENKKISIPHSLLKSFPHLNEIAENPEPPEISEEQTNLF